MNNINNNDEIIIRTPLRAIPISSLVTNNFNSGSPSSKTSNDNFSSTGRSSKGSVSERNKRIIELRKKIVKEHEVVRDIIRKAGDSGTLTDAVYEKAYERIHELQRQIDLLQPVQNGEESAFPF